MALNKACIHINWNGGYYLVMAIIAQAKNDVVDNSISESARNDAKMFLASKGIGGVYDLCLDYEKLYREIEEKRSQGLDKIRYL